MMEKSTDMTILFYCATPINPESGGTERVTYLLAHYLQSRGYTIYYLAPFKPEISSIKSDNISTYFLPDSSGAGSPENRRFLDDLLSELKIDILINQGAWFNELYLCNHKILKTNAKIISCMHFSIDLGLAHFEEMFKSEYSWKEPLSSIKNLIKKIALPYLKQLRYKQRKRTMDFMYQYTDVIVVLSPRYVNEFKGIMKISQSDKIVSIPNPLTFPRTEVKSMNQKENVILFVGRFTYFDKRIDRLLYIWQKLQDRIPDWKLELVGDGMEKVALEKLSFKLGLKNIIFHGFQSPLPYYSKAKIISLVSNHEGLSMSMLEGMQNGCVPVIFSIDSAITDIIIDNVNGCLVKPFDLDMYAEKLYKLASDPSLLNKMQPSVVQSVEQFDMDKWGGKWIDLFRSLNHPR
ncbi:glycosyltransferase [uncultured Parabacteroides sp.]|uniref:glycosyltransferase n=1 Tax=uncultured Parabacteroides sp. TaxID=512312 RepID=UPI00259BBA36|nr:glycosyltransferase [uncultured Parabacteroides sp.]